MRAVKNLSLKPFAFWVATVILLPPALIFVSAGFALGCLLGAVSEVLKMEGLGFKKSVTVWTVGTLAGFIGIALLASGIVKVKGNILKVLWMVMTENAGKIVISNHPSMSETFILPMMLFGAYFFNPAVMPISTPDDRLYYRKDLSFVRPVCIPVKRDDPTGRGAMEFVRKAISVLDWNGSIVLFPEAGRTHKGTEFRTKGKNRVRKFAKGILSLLKSKRKKRRLLIPVWVKGGETLMKNVEYYGEKSEFSVSRSRINLAGEVTIVFGKPFFSDELPADKPSALQTLEEKVLDLSEVA